MPQQTTSQARVIDPILTTVAQGYSQPAGMAGDALFPTISVNSRAGKIIQFSKEDFRLYNTIRSPGGNTRRVQFGYASLPYALEQHALSGSVPIEMMEEAAAVPGLDQARMAVRNVQNIIALRKEKAQADIASTTASYAASNKNTALAGVTLWSDLTSATSDPIGNIETGKEAIRAATGRIPNVLVIGPKVMVALRQHAKIIDRIKYTGRDVPTTELLSSLFGVDRVIVGGSIYADAADAFADVWGKVAILAFTETASMQSQGTPSYGYTYQLRNYPIVEPAYLDRDVKSWVYPVTDEALPVLTSPGSGYIISPAVA